MLFGKKLRQLRDENGVLQRQLADLLEIDTPMFSKIERGDRYAKRRHVPLLAKYFNIDESELLTLWVADKILAAVKGEEGSCLDALEVVKRELTGGEKQNTSKKN